MDNNKISSLLSKKEFIIGVVIFLLVALTAKYSLYLIDSKEVNKGLECCQNNKTSYLKERNRRQADSRFNYEDITSEYEVNTELGSGAALNDNDLTIEEMLKYAIEDESLAKIEYNYIIETYGNINPFSNIINSEETHIELLTPLLEEYNIKIEELSDDNIIKPTSIEEALKIGILAEVNNIKMYQSFLDAELPENVKSVFIDLLNASENHLNAFTRKLSRY